MPVHTIKVHGEWRCSSNHFFFV